MVTCGANALSKLAHLWTKNWPDITGRYECGTAPRFPHGSGPRRDKRVSPNSAAVDGLPSRHKVDDGEAQPSCTTGPSALASRRLT